MFTPASEKHAFGFGDCHVELVFDVFGNRVIAGVLGFGVIAGTAASIAKILFLVFLVLFVIGLVMGRRGPVV